MVKRGITRLYSVVQFLMPSNIRLMEKIGGDKLKIGYKKYSNLRELKDMPK